LLNQATYSTMASSSWLRVGQTQAIRRSDGGSIASATDCAQRGAQRVAAARVQASAGVHGAREGVIRAGSGSPVAFALLALSLPRVLVSVDWSRFSASALRPRVELTKKDVCLFFSGQQLG